MITATYIRQITNGDYAGDARLYRLSEPVSYGWDYETDKAEGETLYVIVSANVVYFSGPETFIFPSDSNGKIIDWAEMGGSFKGSLDHSKAIRNAGWIEEHEQVEMN